MVSLLLLYAVVLATVLLALAYHARVSIPRPPVGRFSSIDVVVMLVVLVVMPFAYLRLPPWAVAGIFGLTLFVVLQLALTPLLGGGGRAGALAAALCAVEIVLAVGGWTAPLVAVNGVFVVMVTVSVTNLWAQLGMGAGQIAALAAALTIYDTLATSVSSVTADFMHRLNGLPFAPMLALGQGTGAATIGLGDCLMLAVWPLVARRVYGRTAGVVAVAIDVILLAGLAVGFGSGLLTGVVPVLTALGPLIVAQYLYWRRHTAPAQAPSRDYLTQMAAGIGAPTDQWVAMHEGTVVGIGPTPGTAHRDARRAGFRGAAVIARERRGTSA